MGRGRRAHGGSGAPTNHEVRLPGRPRACPLARAARGAARGAVSADRCLISRPACTDLPPGASSKLPICFLTSCGPIPAGRPVRCRGRSLPVKWSCPHWGATPAVCGHRAHPVGHRAFTRLPHATAPPLPNATDARLSLSNLNSRSPHHLHRLTSPEVFFRAARATRSCRAHHPTGLRWSPTRIDSPRRGRACVHVSHRHDPERGTCALGVPASPAGADPTIGRQAGLWLCAETGLLSLLGRRFAPAPSMPVRYYHQQGLSRHKQPDEPPKVKRSLLCCPCCVCSGQAREEAVRPPPGFSQPSLPGVRFVPRFAVGELRRSKKSPRLNE